MKKFKLYAMCLFTVVAATMVSCGDDYDDTGLRTEVGDLKSRVEKLEEWSKTTNSQINALQGVISAMESKDYVTGVTTVVEDGKEVGYTLTFSKGDPITIRHGKNGQNGVDGLTPIIGVAQENAVYYWTVKIGTADATWILSRDGQKIPTTGTNGADSTTGKAPKISVDTFTDNKVYWKINDEWLLDASGNKVQATGDKGDNGAAGTPGAKGDAVFANVEVNDGTVVFTLAGASGTSFTLPRSAAVAIFASSDNIAMIDASTPIEVTLALSIDQDSYRAIKAEITTPAGTSTAITRSATPWDISITSPTFENKKVKVQPVITITPKGMQKDDAIVLKVTVIDSKGQEHSDTRMIGPAGFGNEDKVNGSGWDQAYEITTPQQLRLLVTRISEDAKWADKFYKLTADIDLGANNTEEWKTIGNTTQPFAGHFDGGNHTISGKLQSETTGAFGIFGIVDAGAEIKNIHFTGTIEAPKALMLGAIVGQNKGATVLHCTNTANLNTTAAAQVGGIVGLNSGKVMACVNSGTISTAGKASGIANGDVIGCIFKGASVTSTGDMAGGIAVEGNVISSWTTGGTVQGGPGKYAGWLMGQLLEGACIGYVKGESIDWESLIGYMDEEGDIDVNMDNFKGDYLSSTNIEILNHSWGYIEPDCEYHFGTTGEIELKNK